MKVFVAPVAEMECFPASVKLLLLCVFGMVCEFIYGGPNV
jgi:hypothetical protein